MIGIVTPQAVSYSWPLIVPTIDMVVLALVHMALIVIDQSGRSESIRHRRSSAR